MAAHMIASKSEDIGTGAREIPFSIEKLIAFGGYDLTKCIGKDRNDEDTRHCRVRYLCGLFGKRNRDT